MASIDSVAGQVNGFSPIQQGYLRQNPENSGGTVAVDSESEVIKESPTSVAAPSSTSETVDEVSADYSNDIAISEEVVEAYDEAKTNFGDSVKENIQNLQESTRQLKGAIFDEIPSLGRPRTTDSTLNDFLNDNIPPKDQMTNDSELITGRVISEQRREVAANRFNLNINIPQLPEGFVRNYLTPENTGTTDNSLSRGTANSRIEAVENFVNSYNSTLTYFNENRDVSTRMSALADRFADNGSFTETLSSIGITRTSTGALSINEDKLIMALEGNSVDLSGITGNGGLTDTLERNITLTNWSQDNDKLFPSIADFSSDRREAAYESLYTLRDISGAAYSQTANNRWVSMFA